MLWDVENKHRVNLNWRNCPIGLVFLKSTVLKVKATKYCVTAVNIMSNNTDYSPYVSYQQIKVVINIVILLYAVCTYFRINLF
jgi:hypothetical protein